MYNKVMSIELNNLTSMDVFTLDAHRVHYNVHKTFPVKEIGLKWIKKLFSIRMHILNSEYFFLDLIGFNWI